MPTPIDRYVPLLTLAARWAAVAQAPPALVLRHLCEWAVGGGFPEGAFIKPTGQQIDSLDLFMSFRALEAGALSGVYLDGSTFYNQSWGANFFSDVLVSESGVRSFCERTKTMPPPGLLRGRWKQIVFALRYQHLAPPSCQDAEERAAIAEARQFAAAGMNSLRGILAGLKGEPGHRVRRDPDRRVDFHHWAPAWKEQRDSAHRSVVRCHDPGLLESLLKLDADWAAFVADETRAANAGASRETPPRLQIQRQRKSVTLDGQERPIPDLPFKLLLILADKRLRTAEFVSNRVLEEAVWGGSLPTVSRGLRDVVRDLRDAMARGDKTYRELIEGKMNKGYRLTLTPEDVALVD